jgi:hypothetical protein
MTAISIDASELKNLLPFLDKIPAKVDDAAHLAVNEAARFARVQSSREIFKQVNLQKGYIDDRLTVRFAKKGGEPEAIITGRWRPTSLSRFVLREPQRGKPISVRVKRGGPVRKVKGFGVRLNAGAGQTDTKFNRGVVVRVAKGKVLRNSEGAKRMTSMSNEKTDAYLLYGPSINMVFRTVKEDVSGEVSGRLRNEFIRQLTRLNNG